MPTIIERDPIDETIRIFDTFYDVQVNVNAADFDIVNSYFVSVSETKEIADRFTSFFFRISQEANVSVRELLDSIRGQEDNLQMNKVISYYLNAFKSRTSLYGITNILKPNLSVQRNVVL